MSSKYHHNNKLENQTIIHPFYDNITNKLRQSPVNVPKCHQGRISKAISILFIKGKVTLKTQIIVFERWELGGAVLVYCAVALETIMSIERIEWRHETEGSWEIG